ncbi:snaclec coagulation factor IX/factor X-binding protein subunit A-like isoform X2 [Argopecten irradians]|uniref:snaclec coagulation factor IX/factor X-binding protein subunit A-like isoform X2 n=1 Tax=Argopecten irradians TaxID=31199 RepID=UPI00371425AC
MYPIYTFIVVFLLINITYQQSVSQERKQEFCKAAQTNDVLEEVLPLIRRHLETESEICRQRMDGVNAKLGTLETELEATKIHIKELKEASTTSAPTTTTTNAPLECDSGWISSPEKCYHVSSISEKTTWFSAIVRCIDLGARLVEIKTDEEASFIINSLPGYVERTDVFYTGRRMNDNNKWVFLSNDEEVDTSVRTWADGEPEGGSQRCGCTHSNFKMSDWYCDSNRLYICEIKR